MADKFEAWAIVELFGHTTIAGKVSEQSIGGCSFVRVDVPEQEGHAAYTRLLGQGAIYAINPCSEEIARATAARLRPAPVLAYAPSVRALAADPLGFEEDPDGGDDDDDVLS
jgi:hypothetical protein